MAPYILPFIKDRPQSLYRFPDGYKGKSFYQKDVTGKVPDWATTYLYHSEGDKEDKHFLVATDEASLLFMINFGCIDINPWSSTIKKPDHPDWCLLDLDPGTKITFNRVIDAANAIHNLKLPPPKTAVAKPVNDFIEQLKLSLSQPDAGKKRKNDDDAASGDSYSIGTIIV